MIWDSVIWKEELKKELRDFGKFLSNINKYKGDYINLRIEKFFFTSSFIIRKLNEDHKLSDELESEDFSCVEYKRKGIKKVGILDFMNWHHIDRFYNLRKGIKCLLSLKDICNYFIHSFIFIPNLNYKDRPCGIFVNSDRTKNKYLFYIKLTTFVKLLNNVISDDIAALEYNRISGDIKKSKILEN